MSPLPRISVLAAVLSAGMVLPLQAQESPWDIDDIRLGLIEVGTAYQITEDCHRASPRKLRGISTLWKLHRKARAEGFSSEVIDAFVESEVHKTRLEKAVWARLSRHGASPGDPQSICKAAEIEQRQNTLAGSLLHLSR